MLQNGSALSRLTEQNTLPFEGSQMFPCQAYWDREAFRPIIVQGTGTSPPAQIRPHQT